MSNIKKPAMENRLMRSFGRVNGRKLGQSQNRLIDELLPKMSLNIDKKITDISSLFDKKYDEIVVEIGFGKGEHFAEYAFKNPNIGFIGCEPYINGVANCLRLIEENQTDNVKIVHGDARLFFEALPKEVLQKVFILFPDPWPKTKHHKKRIITKNNLQLFSNAVKKGGTIEIATDHADYKIWIEDQLKDCKIFSDIEISDNEPDDWVPTNYQKKAIIEGRESKFYKAII